MSIKRNAFSQGQFAVMWSHSSLQRLRPTIITRCRPSLYSCAHLRSSTTARQYATTKTRKTLNALDTPTAADEPPKQKVAILGSGITALSAAYHLLLTPNPPHITIYEKQPTVGGWLRSKYVDLKDGSGSVLFETGPRNVRPAVPIGLATIALWEDLGLAGNMIVTPRDSVAAKKRWLYYPDHLVELPSPARGILSNLWSIFTEPAFKGFIKDMAYEMSKPPRSSNLEDESVGDFISRRVNKNMVNQVVSAVFHGIYAGDAWQLSARSVLSDAWWAEKKAGNVIQGMMMLQREGWMKRRHAELLEVLTTGQRPSESVVRQVRTASTVTLDGGIQMFADRLKSWLENIGKVDFQMGTEVKSVAMAKDGDSIELTTASSPEPQQYDQIISAIPSRTLSYLTLSEANPDSLSSIAKSPSVTVNVVNLYYEKANQIPIQGFGYLIPQATPFEQNPELALGVVFDSDVVPFGQDRLDVLDTSKAEAGSRGTKLTVMLGGHWYNNLDEVPDEATALEHAKSVVRRHLGITMEPSASLVSQQQDCIPQYTVGHTSRLKSAHNELLRRFGGRLKVTGSSYGGVGLNDCVVSGMEIAGYAAGDESNWKNKTGLEWADSGDDMDYVRGDLYFRERGIGLGGLTGAAPGGRGGVPEGREKR